MDGLRLIRDCIAGGPAGISHAGQSQSRDLRIRHDGRLPGAGQRLGGRSRGTGGVGSLLELSLAMPMMADALLDSVGLFDDR